ncbi:MAG: GspH/FimT family pseudopilin [Gemmatimonadota bacterium]
MRTVQIPSRSRGFTLIEMVVVIAMMGILLAIAIPRLAKTAKTRVGQSAQQLAQDLELARTRALTTRSAVRVTFDAVAKTYRPYLDFNRDSVFAQSQAENDSARAFSFRTLQTGVSFARAGGIPDLPILPGAGAITLTSSRVDFDSRGLTTPFGSKGVIYLNESSDPTAVAAVSVTAASGIRVWIYKGGVWQ